MIFVAVNNWLASVNSCSVDGQRTKFVSLRYITFECKNDDDHEHREEKNGLVRVKKPKEWIEEAHEGNGASMLEG